MFFVGTVRCRAQLPVAEVAVLTLVVVELLIGVAVLEELVHGAEHVAAPTPALAPPGVARVLFERGCLLTAAVCGPRLLVSPAALAPSTQLRKANESQVAVAAGLLVHQHDTLLEGTREASVGPVVVADGLQLPECLDVVDGLVQTLLLLVGVGVGGVPEHRRVRRTVLLELPLEDRNMALIQRSSTATIPPPTLSAQLLLCLPSGETNQTAVLDTRVHCLGSSPCEIDCLYIVLFVYSRIL